MSQANRSRNRALVDFVVLPFLFLTVALLGGLRISAESRTFIFIAPPLITLLLATLSMLLFVRGGLLRFNQWVSGDLSPLTNVAHIWMFITIFFGSAQAFNAVLPERGLFHWLFSFFFLWTLWNNQFSSFDTRRLLRSLTILFGTAFILKYILLASLTNPEGGWFNRIAGTLLQGVTLSSVDTFTFATVSGYIAFFTLALYVVGLIVLAFAVTGETATITHTLVDEYRQLSAAERHAVREAILSDPSDED